MDERGRSIRGITKWCGKPLTEQQQADYKAGKTIRLENVTDKQGQHAIMYVKFNPEKGRRTATMKIRTMPRKSPRRTKAGHRWP